MIRDYMTDHCYPDKISLEQFFDELERGKEPFIQNMKNLSFTESRYIEEWMDMFCNWMEIVKRQKAKDGDKEEKR